MDLIMRVPRLLEHCRTSGLVESDVPKPCIVTLHTSAPARASLSDIGCRLFNISAIIEIRRGTTDTDRSFYCVGDSRSTLIITLSRSGGIYQPRVRMRIKIPRKRGSRNTSQPRLRRDPRHPHVKRLSACIFSNL